MDSKKCFPNNNKFVIFKYSKIKINIMYVCMYNNDVLYMYIVYNIGKYIFFVLVFCVCFFLRDIFWEKTLFQKYITLILEKNKVKNKNNQK